MAAVRNKASCFATGLDTAGRPGESSVAERLLASPVRVLDLAGDRALIERVLGDSARRDQVLIGLTGVPLGPGDEHLLHALDLTLVPPELAEGVTAAVGVKDVDGTRRPSGTARNGL